MMPGTESVRSLNVFSLLLWWMLCISSADAQYRIVREGEGPDSSVGRTLVLPYVFSSETQGMGLGAAGTYGPSSAPQSLYYGTAYATDNGSSLVALGASDVQFPGLERLFLRAYGIGAHYTHMRVYVDGNASFPDERAGSNGSSADNYIEQDAVDLQANLELRYILPIGHFSEEAIHTYVTHNGVLTEQPSGATSWNPFVSGRSSLVLNPQYRRQFTDAGTDETYETLYFELQFEHDNRDFAPNPNQGYLWKAAMRHDPDWIKDSSRWTVAEGELNGYVPLPVPAGIRQQTLALSAWGAYTVDGDRIPYFARPSLGGFHRLRGYPSYRFHDRAAIHYSAEYRVMPEWQPLNSIEVLDPLRIRWWQIVGLVEAGRVAPSWNSHALYRDMKTDVGAGIRVMFDKSIGRADVVVSDEGVSIIAMIGQTF